MNTNLFITLNRHERILLQRRLLSENKRCCFGKLCNGIIKSLNNYSKNTSICKKCACYKVKKFYEKNGRVYRHTKVLFKQNKQCRICKCDDIDFLEFDHIDKKDKNITIGKSFSSDKIKNEIKYTQILCIWCHRLKTLEQNNNDIKKSKQDYIYPFECDIDIFNSQQCDGKLCNGLIRNIENFYFRKDRNKYHKICKQCFNYNNMLSRRKQSNYVDNIKLNIGKCLLCKKEVKKETICCFDFDHIDQSTKKFTICSLRQKVYNKQKVLNEIKKCHLLCCYCHKKKTIKQLNYITYNEIIEKRN